MESKKPLITLEDKIKMESEKPLTTVEEKITYDPSGEKKTTITTTVHKKDDGTIKVSENVVTKTQKNEINVQEAKIIGTKNIEAGADERKYIEAIHYKGEVAILKTENEIMNILKFDSLEKILKLMGRTLEDFCYDISYGIYTSEEIVEFRNSYNTRNSIKRGEYVKEYDYMLPIEERFKKKLI